MKITNLLTGLLVAAATTVGGGCAGTATYSTSGYASADVVVYDPPPAPRVVITPRPRAGFVYVQGRWFRNGAHWVWRDGFWERERVGYYYAPGRWQRRNAGGYVWVQGRWNAGNGRGRGRVIVR